jgi:hypothetical protein
LREISALSVIDLLFGLSMFKKALVIFAAIPFVASFCSDWNTQYIRFMLARSSVRRYTWSKVTVCSVSSFTVVFLGLLFFLLFLSFLMPVFPQDIEAHSYPPFGSLLTSGFPMASLLLTLFIFAVGNSFWVICGLTLSAYLPNRFIAVLSPFVFSYFLEEVSSGFPTWISLYHLTRVRDVIGLGALPSLIYFIFIFGLLIFICGLIFSHQVKRRVQNEVV